MGTSMLEYQVYNHRSLLTVNHHRTHNTNLPSNLSYMMFYSIASILPFLLVASAHPTLSIRQAQCPEVAVKDYV
jgi:hypothetical protein